MAKEMHNVKVYGKFVSRDKSYRPQIRLRHSVQANAPVEHLIAEGLWLSESGFDVGDHISVICKDGRLTINRNKASLLLEHLISSP